MTYDASRLANFGRDTARTHAAFKRSSEKLTNEINSAIASGIAPLKVAHDVFGRCSSRNDQMDLLSALMALGEMGRIPKSVIEPFEEGIRARRV